MKPFGKKQIVVTRSELTSLLLDEYGRVFRLDEDTDGAYKGQNVTAVVDSKEEIWEHDLANIREWEQTGEMGGWLFNFILQDLVNRDIIEAGTYVITP